MAMDPNNRAPKQDGVVPKTMSEICELSVCVFDPHPCDTEKGTENKATVYKFEICHTHTEICLNDTVQQSATRSNTD